MKPPAMHARRGAFGIFIVEHVRPTTPHVLLPREKPAASLHELWQEDAFMPMPGRGLQAFISTNTRPNPGPPAPSTPEQLRKLKELEAARTNQPWGWGASLLEPSRVYMSVSGLRWRCCGNPFDESHSPWCAVARFDDPFPEPL